MLHELAYERLRNGLTRAFDRGSKLSGCWNADGTPRHGDLTLGPLAKHISAIVKLMATTGAMHYWEII